MHVICNDKCLIPGNYKVEFMFKRAWRIYQKHTNRLDQPGTDQSIIQDCLHKSHDHKKIRLSWGFFPDSKVALVDKIYKFETQNIELGEYYSSEQSH